MTERNFTEAEVEKMTQMALEEAFKQCAAHAFNMAKQLIGSDIPATVALHSFGLAILRTSEKILEKDEGGHA